MVKKDPHVAREAQKYETPIPSREFILTTLNKMGKPVKRGTIAKHFDLNDPDLLEALRRRLKAMVRDGQLLKTSQGYIPITEVETCKGILVMEREWEGFLKTAAGKTILLSGPTLRGYYDGDEVDVQIVQIDKEGFARGRIIKLHHAVTPMVIGRLIAAQDKFEVLPFDRKFSQNIVVDKNRIMDAKNGDIVQVKILREEPSQYAFEPSGEVVEILGDYSMPGIEVKMAMRKFKIPHEWPKAVLKECEKLPKEVKDPKDVRTDIRDLPLVTIDGEDAKDFDDAVYCEKFENGWRLWVAIADVSYYVKPGSALEKEAILRGNSTYFPGSVVPMLPEVLSNGLCSLKPEVPRLCVVCQMTIDKEGLITRSKFYRAIMLSHARLTYTEVAEMLRGNSTLEAKYKALLPSIHSLHELYHALHKERVRRGAIDFDTVETRIMFDKAGKIKSIVPQVRNVAHKMIEESMLAANVCAAKYIQRHKRGTLFRIHDRPPQDKLKALRQFLSELGLNLGGGNKPQAMDFSRLISQVQHREDKHLIETVMLRSLSQAQYHPKNIGHFGLAYGSYLHFTSPIRRYPDLVVHRAIVDITQNKKPPAQEIDFEKLGEKCSESERRSDEATRDASMALKCHYMQDKVGETYRGIITGVASFGIFVELKDIYIEGLVHVTGLGNEYFNYDPAHHRMIGERSRTVYRLGDAVEVTVVRVDIEAKKIDLELLGAPKVNRASTKKPSRKPQHHRSDRSGDGKAEKGRRRSRSSKDRKKNRKKDR